MSKSPETTFTVHDAASFQAPKGPDTFRILHLSDVHAGLREFSPAYLLDKRFFGRLNQFTTRQRHLKLENLERFAELQKRLNADFTVCTGDLTSIGSKEEFLHAETLMEKILANADGRFLYVPGNHDAYVAKNSDALREACLHLNGAEQKAERPPRLVQCGPVEFVALDAARPCLIWQSTGELTASAWANLDYILHRQLPEGCRARVLCSHFPLVNHRGERLSWRTRMLGDTRLENLLAANPVSAFLTGHVHYPFIHRVGGGSCAAVGAGSITIHSSCAVIDIDARTGKAAPAILRF